MIGATVAAGLPIPGMLRLLLHAAEQERRSVVRGEINTWELGDDPQQQKMPAPHPGHIAIAAVRTRARKALGIDAWVWGLGFMEQTSCSTLTPSLPAVACCAWRRVSCLHLATSTLWTQRWLPPDVPSWPSAADAARPTASAVYTHTGDASQSVGLGAAGERG